MDLDKLSDQRKQCSDLSEKHREGLALMEDLESCLAQLGESEGAAGTRNSSVPRHLIDLMTRLNNQADHLRSRMGKINENEKKAVELEDTRKDVEAWIDGQAAAIENLPTPANKEELQNVSGQIERLEKGVRQERRKVEDVSTSFESVYRNLISVITNFQFLGPSEVS